MTRERKETVCEGEREREREREREKERERADGRKRNDANKKHLHSSTHRSIFGNVCQKKNSLRLVTW